MFQNISFRYKLFFIPVIAVLALITEMTLSQRIIRKNTQTLDGMIQSTVPVWEMSRNLKKMLRATQVSVQKAFLANNPAAIKDAETLRSQFLDRIDAEKNNRLYESERFQNLKEMYLNYYALVIAQCNRQWKTEAAGRTQLDTTVTAPVYNELRYRLDAITLNNEKQMEKDLQTLRAQNGRMVRDTLISMCFFLLLIVGLAVVITPGFLRPLKIAIDVADMVARGDLTVRVPSFEGNDEMANLLRVFRTMVENLRTLTEQIKEAVSALASASTEISASVTEIASGATETATAANETSTTVEEVRQTALDANRKAKHVSESAQKAVQISMTGERAVATTVEGIRRIEVQMESIAESIMKLSEHGQAIGGIIATVEDVAEQSNLLAVNASIEAARAGEHGKGFAVVAHEVKSLAEQSKQSTSRVRNILDDIQRATSGAVMTTEQGSKAVEAGVKQSQEAGDSIQRLAASVEEAAQATTQIAVSSQEQLVGMDQVVAAMESIKQASAQNVTSTKQVESAAHDLQELGQRLKHLVEQYKL